MPLPSGTPDQNRDLSHDLLPNDLYDGAAFLVTTGQNLSALRIASFYSCLRGDPHWDTVLTEYCVPSAEGTSNLQSLSRIWAMTRPNVPTAIQYTPNGTDWLWLSDVLGKTITNPPGWPPA